MGGLLPLGGRTTPGVGANVLFVPRGSASSFWAVTIVMIDRRDRTFIFVCFIVIVICNGLGSGRRGRISVSFSIVDKKVIEIYFCHVLCGAAGPLLSATCLHSMIQYCRYDKYSNLDARHILSLVFLFFKRCQACFVPLWVYFSNHFK